MCYKYCCFTNADINNRRGYVGMFINLFMYVCQLYLLIEYGPC